MKEAIEKILTEFAFNYKQINFDSPAARELLAEFISDKLSGTLEENSYNNNDCCNNNCGCHHSGCDSVDKYYST